MKKLIGCLLVLGMVAATPSYGLIVGSLSYSKGEIVALNEWQPDLSKGQDWAVAWEIDQLSSGEWSYEYTFTLPYKIKNGELQNSFKEVSHLAIQLTPDTRVLQDSLVNAQYEADFANAHGSFDSHAAPLIPLALKELYGVCLKPGTYVHSFPSPVTWTFSFLSMQSPVPGSFYAKDGGGTGADANVAWNNFNGDDGGYFIMRPDGNAVPDTASSMAMLGMAMLAVEGLRRKFIR
jgi:hypothetical protein